MRIKLTPSRQGETPLHGARMRLWFCGGASCACNTWFGSPLQAQEAKLKPRLILAPSQGELTQTMYQPSIILPESNVHKNILLKMDEHQTIIKNIIDRNF
jgi:hypothetical protein